MLLSDKFIRDKYSEMIEPFVPHQVSEVAGKKIISYGLSSFGYDIRLSHHYSAPVSTDYEYRLDPKDEIILDYFVHLSTKNYITMRPHSMILGASLERIKVPRNVLVTCQGKSTYARCGIIVNVTPLEPEWEGHITMCFINPTPFEIPLYVGEGCAQLLFHINEPCETSYADRKGKYQGQKDVTLSKV